MYLDAKVSILGAIANVAGGDHVYTSANACVVDSGNHGFLAFFNGCEGRLEVLHWMKISGCAFLFIIFIRTARWSRFLYVRRAQSNV